MLKNLLTDTISKRYPGIDFDIFTPPDPKMGDYSINLAFVLAKKENRKPNEVGDELIGEFKSEDGLKGYFKKIELAGGGFINFHISDDFLRSQTVKIIGDKENFGNGTDKKIKINLEFVSANPTGPITVHNIRAAPFGDALANVLKKSGYDVVKEYYINDAGNQVRLLGESVARKLLRLRGKEIDFPENLYQGEYITDIAKEINEGKSDEAIDNFDELVIFCRDYTVKKLTESIKKSLKNMGVEFDVWFSEKKMHDSGEVSGALKILEKSGKVYEKDGAKWLKLDDSGEHDAVLVKSDGLYSYLMGDIAYTGNKFGRGFDKAINIWGADHHGDVLRLKSGVKALGHEDERLQILLHQMVSIKSEGEKQRMSKRKGEFVLLDELLKEAGADAVRFFFLMKDLNTHMEFDVGLAKEQSKKNPVYYIQYAYARLNSIFSKLRITNYELRINEGDLELLKEPEELLLMRALVKFPELIEEISGSYQIHHLAQYAFYLASVFHNFYEKHHVAGDDKKLEMARVNLCLATSSVLKSVLGLMGVSAPERMDSKESEGA